MATSGSFDFNLTTIQIVEASARKVGALADGQSLTNEQIDNYKIYLNAMVKSWRADNIFLWEEEFITLPMQLSSVVLGTDGVDYQCIRNHRSVAANQPVTGNKYVTFWKALTTTAGAAWVTDTDYVSISNYSLDTRIIDVEKGRLREIPSNNTRPLTKVTQEGFFDLSDETTTGEPDQFYFRRNLVTDFNLEVGNKLRPPELFVYPRPINTTDFVLEFWVCKYPQDFDANNNDPDFLQEWLEALIDGLAVRIAPTSGIFGSDLRDLQNIAKLSKDRARKMDHETGDLRISPNFRGA